MLYCYVTLQYTGTRLLHIGSYARFRFISQTVAVNQAHFGSKITKNIGFGENILRNQNKTSLHVCFLKPLKGHCHGLTCAEAFTLADLKYSFFEINTFMAFRPRFLVVPSAIILSFRPELLLFPSCPKSTSRRHIENASVQLENIRLTFSSFGSDFRACQLVTVCTWNLKSVTSLITSVKHLSNGNTNKLLSVIWKLLISPHF